MLPMEGIFFTQPQISGPAFQCCLKIMNARGDELSLALDNSAGAHTIAWRGDLRVFDASTDADLGEPITRPTPEQFLERLATHLGYTIRPNTRCIPCETTIHDRENCDCCRENGVSGRS